MSEFIVNETQIKIGKDYFWIWVALESDNKTIVGIHLSLEKNMLVAEQFLQNIIKKYGRHPVLSDGGTWYVPACKFLKLKHHINSSYEKSIIERIIQYIKDRTENFDDYFPCNKNKCKLKHVVNWFHLFVDYYNKEAICLS